MFFLAQSLRLTECIRLAQSIWLLMISNVGLVGLVPHSHEIINNVESILELRNATAGDLDALVDIDIAAFRHNPARDYLFPYRYQYPEDYQHCTKEDFEIALNYNGGENGSFTVKVVTLSSSNMPIALAVWDRRIKTLQERVLPPCNYRRDGNPIHISEWFRTTAGAKKQDFDEVFGNAQIYLLLLATHPDYQRRGAASMLVQWGVDVAKKEDLEVTVMADPSAEGFYDHMGFEHVKVVDIQVEGEEEKVSVVVMQRNGTETVAKKERSRMV